MQPINIGTFWRVRASRVAMALNYALFEFRDVGALRRGRLSVTASPTVAWCRMPRVLAVCLVQFLPTALSLRDRLLSPAAERAVASIAALPRIAEESVEASRKHSARVRLPFFPRGGAMSESAGAVSAELGTLTGNEHGHAPNARDAVRGLRPSQIREVANAGFGIPDVLPFWFGESDRVTPNFIRDAASRALADGATFYTHNLGIAPLREALASYVGEVHGATTPGHIAVTSAGVNALMLAAQLVTGAGDRVVAVTPLWPNLVEIPKILGAHVETVSLTYGAGGWTLDLERLLAALTPSTRMLMINSPNNPTGWTMTRDEQRTVLAHCRRHGIWIVADEVYERLYYGADGRVAPSFLDLATRDERVIAVNSFSKAWLMTGWRLGWLVAPTALMDDLGKLVEYNTSCAPSFVQEAGVVAVREGEAFTQSLVADLHASRDHLVSALQSIPGVDVRAPLGAMYLFFSMPGAERSLELCKALVREAGLGLAPGSAFGAEGEGFVRWCYACDPARLDVGVERLRAFLSS